LQGAAQNKAAHTTPDPKNKAAPGESAPAATDTTLAPTTPVSKNVKASDPPSTTLFNRENVMKLARKGDIKQLQTLATKVFKTIAAKDTEGGWSEHMPVWRSRGHERGLLGWGESRKGHKDGKTSVKKDGARELCRSAIMKALDFYFCTLAVPPVIAGKPTSYITYPHRIADPQNVYPHRIADPQNVYPHRIADPQNAYPHRIADPQYVYPHRISDSHNVYPRRISDQPQRTPTPYCRSPTTYTHVVLHPLFRRVR